MSDIREIIRGEDWSQVFAVKIDPEDQGEQRRIFDRYTSMANVEKSPYNLGLYQTRDSQEKEVVRSTQYVGAMPLLFREGEERETGVDLIIGSRFPWLSPTMMIKRVLEGADYYDTPEMLETKVYSKEKWLSMGDDTIKNKTLFGLIDGIPEVAIKTAVERKDGFSQNSEIGCAENEGVFEIIDFIHKAKELCRKNLKKQSENVEENMIGKVKGRILVPKQIKYNDARGQSYKTYCSYNKITSNIKENQIIKYALYLCQRSSLGDSLHEDIYECMNCLVNVALVKCNVSDFVGLKNNGAYRAYKPALQAAKKIITRYAISYDNAGDSDKGPYARIQNYNVKPYFIDMNILFEFYCRAVIRYAVDEYNLEETCSLKFYLESTKYAKKILFNKSPRDKRGEAGIEDGMEDVYPSVKGFFMQEYIPDMVINYEYVNSQGAITRKGVAAIFDAKYSSVNSSDPATRRARTHQVLFYMQAMGCKYGGLISPYDKEYDNIESLMSLSNILVAHCKDLGEGSGFDWNPKDSSLAYIPFAKKTAPGDQDALFKDHVVLVKEHLKKIKETIEVEHNAFELVDYITENKGIIDKIAKEGKNSLLDQIKNKIEKYKKQENEKDHTQTEETRDEQ